MSSASVLAESAIAAMGIDEATRRLMRLVRGPDAPLGALLADLGKMWSPHELAALYRRIIELTPETGLARIRFALLAPMWAGLSNGEGAVFHREALSEGSVLFRSEVKAPERRVIVCFTGIRNGMFMANCRFLQLLGKHPVDVVMNWTDSGSFGQWRLDRAGSFARSLDRLTGVLGERGIRAGLYVGTSAGGGAAVQAAVLDPSVAAVVFGCRFYVPGRSIPLAQAGYAFEPMCDCRSGPLPVVHNIFGALNPIDIENDARLRHLVPGARSWPLPKDDKHSPMVTLTARRKLRGVLDKLVLAASGAAVDFGEVTCHEQSQRQSRAG
jgi:hypothetical protein